MAKEKLEKSGYSKYKTKLTSISYNLLSSVFLSKYLIPYPINSNQLLFFIRLLDLFISL